MSAIAGALGMGITIQLRDMFTPKVGRIGAASRALSNMLINDSKKVNAAYGNLTLAGGFLTGGGLLAGLLGLIGYKAVKTSSELEIFRRQFVVLTGSVQTANNLFKQITAFAADTPFTIPQVMVGTKNLLAFGVAAKDVKDQLRIAGDWASIFNVSIERTTEVLGRIQSGGYGQAIRALRSMGVNPRALKDFGVPIKDGIMQKNADPNVVLAGINRYIQKRFGGGMAMQMDTIPGRVSNIQDKVILSLGKIGDAMKTTVFGVVKSIEQALDPDKVSAFATAFGQGLALIAKGLTWLLAPFGYLITGMMTLAQSHPGIIKVGTAVLGLAAGVLLLTGAMIAYYAIKKLILLSGAGSAFTAMKVGLLGALPVIGWVALALFALYAAFKGGDNGVVGQLKYWYDTITMVAKGVWELVSSVSNGVGYMSTGTAAKLKEAGLMEATKTIFMVLYRGYQIVAGVFAGLMPILSGFGYALGWVIRIVSGLIGCVMTMAHWLGIGARSVGTENYKELGRVIGWVAGILLVCKVTTMALAAASWIQSTILSVLAAKTLIFAGAMRAWSVAAGIAKAVTWLLNAALGANPIVWIIAAVIALVAGVVLLIVYWKQIHAWIKKAPDWLLWLVMPVGLIIKHWDKIKVFFTSLWTWIKGMFQAGVEGLVSIVASIFAFFLRMTVKVLKLIPKWALPKGLEGFRSLDPDKITGEVVTKGFMSGLQAREQSRLAGTGQVGSAAAGLKAMAATIAENAKTPQQTTITVPLHIDGKKVGQAVAQYQSDEHESGR